MNEITLKDEALRVDREMQLWASQMTNAVYNIGKCMTEMKEKELYRELGYDTFEDYCEQKYQLKKSQTAKYISVYQNLDETYLLENQNIGIQKLYMLSQVSEEDREAVGTPDGYSVSELKAELEKVKAEREGIQMQFDSLMEEKKTEEDGTIEQLNQKLEELQKEKDQASIKLLETVKELQELKANKDEEVEKLVADQLEDKLANENISARRRIDELSEKLQNVKDEYAKDQKIFSEQAGKYSALRADKEMLETQAEQLKAKIKDLENKPTDVAVAEPDPAEVERRAAEIAEQKIKEMSSDTDSTLKDVAEAKVRELEAKLELAEKEKENIRAGFEKKLENLKANSESAESTQVEAEPEEDEKAKMRRLLSAIVNDANTMLDEINLSSDPDFWLTKMRGVFADISQKLTGTAF